MFKKITIASAILAMASFAYAGADVFDTEDSSSPFIGLELGGTFVQGDTDAEKSHKGKGFSVGLRLGAQNEQWRSMVMFDYYNNKTDKQKYERALIQVDYFIMPDTFAGTMFKPYVGVNGGYLNYESKGIDTSGITYGGQIGVQATVSDHIDVDLGYRYSIARPKELGNIGNIALGVHYVY